MDEVTRIYYMKRRIQQNLAKMGLHYDVLDAVAPPELRGPPDKVISTQRRVSQQETQLSVPYLERVGKAMILYAVSQKDVCPISQDDLETGNAVCTSCFHCYERASFEHWHSLKGTCPLCKIPCTFVKV